MRRRPEQELDYSWPPIAEVIEHYFGYDHAPRRGKARCPYHDDHNPSASVREDEGSLHCFACGVHVTGLGIVMRQEDCDVDSAKRIAAGLFGSRDGDVPGEPAPGGGVAGKPGDPPRPRRRLPIGRRRRTLLGT